ncbi:MAG: diguanylate cyclase [Arcobacteraceae bacterium]
MMPTVSDICIKEIVSIKITATILDAVKLMKDNNVRSILILGSVCDNYFILTANHAIEYKVQNISLDTPLSQIELEIAHKIDANINVLELINQEELESEYLIVLDNNTIIGILSQTDIINNIDPQILIQKQSIANVMLQYTVQTIYQDEATINAIKIMKAKEIDSIIVINNENKPLGIFTTKDFLNIINNDANLNLPIKTYMSAPLETLPSSVKIYEALEFIRQRHFKRIVVTNEFGKITGLITQTELLRLINNKWMELIKDRGNQLSEINKKLMEKTSMLEQNASTDFLTKLYNRRKFDALLEYEIEQIKRYKHGSLSMILLDIDNFKKINDIYGHDIGDEILKEIGKIIKFSSRNSDVACRWGGEEFALSLSHTNIEDAFLVAQKIRATIESYSFINDLKITCSFGVSEFRTTDTLTSLFKRADLALYEAKNTGKNRVAMERL